MKLTKKQLKQTIKEELAEMERLAFASIRETKEQKDPKAKVRNRGSVVFPAESKNVKDDKDHFPINSKAQARNALARASQYKKVPKWYTGSLISLVKTVQSKVKNKYPDIETTKKSAKPGKN